MNYEAIKEIAKDAGVRVTELIALAPQNDPFYVGRPSENEAAYWFSDYWNHFGYSGGIHLRRIHYRMVSQSPAVIMPNGLPYENTQGCWAFLNNASKWARYLGLVDPGAFVDRRNPEALVNVDYDNEDLELSYELNHDSDDYVLSFPALDDVTIPQLPPELPSFVDFDVEGYWFLQPPVHVEIWCEKTTMNDILAPICQAERINLVTGAGELSITATLQFMDRVATAGRPARIIYISDFDPAGLGMPISVARKIEYWQHELAHSYGDLDIRLEPVVLTLDQVQSYKLPRVPVKDSDKRKGHWERDFGRGAVELDALEALHPGELDRIVHSAISKYRDGSFNRNAYRLRNDLIWELDDKRTTVLQDDDISDAITELHTTYADIVAEVNELSEAIEEAIRPFLEDFDELRKRLESVCAEGGRIDQVIAQRLSGVDVDMDKYALPTPDITDTDAPLYDSQRDYIDQLAIYKSYRSTGELE